MTAFVEISKGQQSFLFGAQPTSGNNTAWLETVASAKTGAVQVPVSNAAPANVAVTWLIVEMLMVSVTIPAIVENNPVLLLCVVLVEDRIPVELVAFNGEHPTKSGAVALTAAHCCWLNVRAAIRDQYLIMVCNGSIHTRLFRSLALS